MRAAHRESQQMVVRVAEGIHIVEVGPGSRSILCLERDFPRGRTNHGRQGVLQSSNIVLHVFQVPDVQLCHLKPEQSIFFDRGGLWEILRFVPVDFLPDVAAGVDISHHVVQHRFLQPTVCPEQLMIFC